MVNHSGSGVTKVELGDVPSAPTIGARTGHHSQYWLLKVNTNKYGSITFIVRVLRDLSAMLLTWRTVSNHRGREPRTQIASRINGEACGYGL